MSEVESRIARQIAVKHGREPNDPATRHGSLEVAQGCTDGQNGGKCELCHRVAPGRRKKRSMRLKAERTNACAKLAARGHALCGGWRFAPGTNALDTASRRGATPCQCGCHTDGRGHPIPPLEEWLAKREAAAEYTRLYWAEQNAAAAARPESTPEARAQ